MCDECEKLKEELHDALRLMDTVATNLVMEGAIRDSPKEYIRVHVVLKIRNFIRATRPDFFFLHSLKQWKDVEDHYEKASEYLFKKYIEGSTQRQQR